MKKVILSAAAVLLIASNGFCDIKIHWVKGPETVKEGNKHTIVALPETTPTQFPIAVDAKEGDIVIKTKLASCNVAALDDKNDKSHFVMVKDGATVYLRMDGAACHVTAH